MENSFPRVITPESGTSCSVHADASYRSWCEITIANPNVQRNRTKALEASLARCKWQTTQSTTREIFYGNTTGVGLLDAAHTKNPVASGHWTGHSPPSEEPSYDLFEPTQHTQEWCRDGAMVYHRIGPFVTTGGFDWTKFYYHVHGGGPEDVSSWRGAALLEGYFAGSTTRSGQLIGNRP